MEPIEIKLLKYTFRFRPLSWREQSAVKFDPKKSRTRTLLSHALSEISGLKVKSSEEAAKVLEAIPASVIERVLILYRGAQPAPRTFTTVGLYKAPDLQKFAKNLETVEKQSERIMDKVEREMEQKFGRKELEEALEVERLMVKNSKLRGATRPSPEKQ